MGENVLETSSHTWSSRTTNGSLAYSQMWLAFLLGLNNGDRRDEAKEKGPTWATGQLGIRKLEEGQNRAGLHEVRVAKNR